MRGIEIIFTAPFGGENRTVMLRAIVGLSALERFALTIDNCNNGQIIKKNNKRHWLNQPEAFTAEDCLIIGEWIEQKLLEV